MTFIDVNLFIDHAVGEPEPPQPRALMALGQIRHISGSRTGAAVLAMLNGEKIEVNQTVAEIAVALGRVGLLARPSAPQNEKVR